MLERRRGEEEVTLAKELEAGKAARATLEAGATDGGVADGGASDGGASGGGVGGGNDASRIPPCPPSSGAPPMPPMPPVLHATSSAKIKALEKYRIISYSPQAGGRPLRRGARTRSLTRALLTVSA